MTKTCLWGPRCSVICMAIAGLIGCAGPVFSAGPRTADAKSALQQGGIRKGVCAVVGLPAANQAGFVIDLARDSELLVYFQSADREEIDRVRKAAEDAALLGSRVFVDQGEVGRIHLADNIAGAIFVAPSVQVPEKELLRVLHPRGKAILGSREIIKPFPQGTDDWSHVFHRPDNNPQSTDRLAKAPYLTQFLAEPYFCPMPEVSVAAGGRIFRAFGHIAHKANQNPMLNTLIGVNAFNGTILWKRSLPEGFMIHRNTMVATPDALYLADNRSCKLLDPETGEVKDEIVAPSGISDGPVWKWMALVDGVLYALVGAEEFSISTQPSKTPGLGHWPWGMWEGHKYDDPKRSFGFGRTFFAMDVKSKQVQWVHRTEDYVDARGVCMRGNRIYYYSPEKFLACFDVKKKALEWKNSDSDLLAAIGPNGPAQHYVTGYATTTYIKCNDDYLFFAGPQRSRFVVASTKDGRFVWDKEHGNFQIVLRDDGIYAAGPQQPKAMQDTTYKFAYADGAVLAQLTMRRACTRATGSIDSVFFRAAEGTVRVDTATNSAHHIAPMRPPCQDGVIISDGNLYWGPWMCGCALSLYGHVCLTSAGDFNYRPGLESSRHASFPESAPLKPLDVQTGDWPTYQGDNARSAKTSVSIPKRVAKTWTYEVPSGGFPSAPVTADGCVFFGDRNGAVRAVRARDGQLLWQAYTGGPIYFPPAIDGNRLFVGSADGRVYAFEATSGRPLWNFRAAPVDRWIPVYGKLISTWPVSGGVLVQDGTVYAAAGIAHYDGTHVYALDAATGKIKWYNDRSGTTSEKVSHGVSLQGELYIRDGELRFIGGGVHEEARYDLATGKCLNPPSDTPQSSYPTSFYAYFPDYGKYVSLDCPLADGKALCYDASYEGSLHGNLMLLPTGQRRQTPLARWNAQRSKQVQAIWQATDRRFNGFIVSDKAVVAAGHTGSEGSQTSFLAALNVSDGTELWRQNLPGPVVKGGAAINRAGQVFISLENGKILAYSASD